MFCVAVGPAIRTATGLSRLKAVAVNLSRPFGRRGLYSIIIAFSSRRLTGDKSDGFPHSRQYRLRKSFILYPRIVIVLRKRLERVKSVAPQRDMDLVTYHHPSFPASAAAATTACQMTPLPPGGTCRCWRRGSPPSDISMSSTSGRTHLLHVATGLSQDAVQPLATLIHRPLASQNVISCHDVSMDAGLDIVAARLFQPVPDTI